MKVIEELKSVIDPPAAPNLILNSTVAWQCQFDRLGTRLPEDFVQFHQVFGAGYFYSRTHKSSANLSIYGGLQRFSLNESVPKRLSELRLAKERRPKSVPYPLYWEPHGLLPWGRTSNGTDLCWSVRGILVDDWPVIVLHVSNTASELFDCCMAEFLTGQIRGTIRSKLMPTGFPGEKWIGFEAWPFRG